VTEEIGAIGETAMVVTVTETANACLTATEIGTAIVTVIVTAIGTAVVAEMEAAKVVARVPERTLDASDPVRMTAKMTTAPEDGTRRSFVFLVTYGHSPFPSQSRLAGGYP
jgi:CBS domain containing-hemolysin-like protein